MELNHQLKPYLSYMNGTFNDIVVDTNACRVYTTDGEFEIHGEAAAYAIAAMLEIWLDMASLRSESIEHPTLEDAVEIWAADNLYY
jgi:hypothetical protein